MRTAIVVLLVAVVLVSCTSRPSRVDGAPRVAPDEQYEVGGTWADRFRLVGAEGPPHALRA